MHTLKTSSAKRSTVTASAQRITGLDPKRIYALSTTTAAYVAQGEAEYLETYAELDLADLGDGDCDTVVRAATRGAAGNDLTVELVGDGAALSNVVIDESTDDIVIHYESGVSTVGDVETAIALTTKLDVKTAGTGATVLTAPADDGGPESLAGGGETDLAAQSAPTATAGNGSTLVPAGGTIHLHGIDGAQVSVVRATADGECTLTQLLFV